MRKVFRAPGLLCALASVAALSGAALAAPQGLASAWRTQPIVVDGITSEWPKLEAVPRGPEIGVSNDGEFLYFAVSTSHEDLRELLATGLILWLDPNGGKAQVFGVWVPGVAMRALPGATPPAPDDSAGISARALDHFDLLGPGKNQRRLVDITPALGIEVASGTQEKGVMYEVKIPIAKTAERLYAVGAQPGKTIGLGIATPEAPRDRSGRRDVLVGSSGTIGGSPWRGGGFAPFRERSEDLKPLDVWTTLRLATK